MSDVSEKTAILDKIMSEPTKHDLNPCEKFKQAQEVDTDHQGYGALMLRNCDNEWIIGRFYEIKFCPWCGKSVNVHPEEDDGEECR